MPVLDTAFEVEAPLEVVAAFHQDTGALKKLTPPPIFIRLLHVEPLGEGSRSQFIMWFGPIPVHWTARHIHVDRLHGFTDIQERGPLAFWRHTHRFEAISARQSRVHDHVEYSYRPGAAGLANRLLFHPIAMRILFAYRAWATRRGVRAFA